MTGTERTGAGKKDAFPGTQRSGLDQDRERNVMQHHAVGGKHHHTHQLEQQLRLFGQDSRIEAGIQINDRQASHPEQGQHHGYLMRH